MEALSDTHHPSDLVECLPPRSDKNSLKRLKIRVRRCIFCSLCTFEFTLHLLTSSSVVSAFVVVVLVFSALFAGRALRLHDPRYFCGNTERIKASTEG